MRTTNWKELRIELEIQLLCDKEIKSILKVVGEIERRDDKEFKRLTDELPELLERLEE